MRAMRRVLLTTAVLAVTLVALYRADRPTRPAEAAALTVDMENFFFSSSAIPVTEGDTITWNNNSSVSHITTDGTRGNSPFDGWDEIVSAGSSSPSVTFNTAGTFSYHCRLITGRVGTHKRKALPVTASGGPLYCQCVMECTGEQAVWLQLAGPALQPQVPLASSKTSASSVRIR
mgnify:CR=1 FL=1